MSGLSLIVIAVAVGSAAAALAGEARPPLNVSSVADRALAAQPGDTLLLVVGDKIMVARVDRAGISSRGIRLRISGAQIGGQVGGQRVQLEMADARISGQIGSQRVSLDVLRREGALDISGHFGAHGVSADLTPGAVTAEVGPCRYTLKFQQSQYYGQVGCGGKPEPVSLRIPATLAAHGDVELAALFIALLAR